MSDLIVAFVTGCIVPGFLQTKKDHHPFNLAGYYAKMENLPKPLFDKAL
jgi:hypothetical protein